MERIREMKGIIINPSNRVVIDIFTLESGHKFIGAYINPDKVKDITFEQILRRTTT